MPEARGDIREIVGQPVFVPLYKLFITYGPVFRLSFGPKSFIVVSDNQLAKQVCFVRVCVRVKNLTFFNHVLKVHPSDQGRPPDRLCMEQWTRLV